MTADLEDAIQMIKSKKGMASYDEITTKQTIVLQLFQALGWSIFDKEEVLPEYSVENRRVDFSLRLQSKNMVFVEVKKPSEELEKHEEQLLDYSFRQGIELAVLTNGVTWWFYLPMLGEKWSSRKFYTIDIQEQDTESICRRFLDLLSRQSVYSGNAVKSAEKIHQDRKKSETIIATLPDAWNKLIGEPDSLLVELLVDTAEKICGFRPQAAEINNFIADNRDRILLDTIDEPYQKIEADKLKPNLPLAHHKVKKSTGKGSGRIAVLLNGNEFEGTSIPTLFYSVLKHMVDNGTVGKAKIPWGVGTTRYFIFKGERPIHQNGKDFRYPVTYEDYHLEAHVNRSQGVKYLGALSTMIGYKFTIVEM